MYWFNVLRFISISILDVIYKKEKIADISFKFLNGKLQYFFYADVAIEKSCME